MINLNLLEKPSYNALRLQLISKVEEGGNLSPKVYLDSKGIPTIGAGMNLRSEEARNVVFSVILGSLNSLPSPYQAIEIDYRNKLIDIFQKSYPKTKAGESQLRSDLDKVMADRAADNRITFENKRTTFEFANDQEIRNAFETLAKTYEDRVDTWYGSIISDSYERLALLSLAYNGVLGSSNLLKQAITSGNRAEAWYQIRYQSNGDRLPGIAKRRYYESQVFGLYDEPNAIIQDEAENFARMYASHSKQMIEYDQKYLSRVDKANIDYSSSGTVLDNKITRVQTLAEASLPSRQILSSLYGSNNIVYDEVLLGSTFSDSLATAASLLTDHSTKDFPQTSLLIGNEGQDNYITKLDSKNILIVGNGDGRVSVNSKVLTGSIQCKTSKDGNKLDNIWTYEGLLDIHKISSTTNSNQYDLVIVKIGEDPNNSNTFKITLKNIPSQQDRIFGFLLDKTQDGVTKTSKSYSEVFGSLFSATSSSESNFVRI